MKTPLLIVSLLANLALASFVIFHEPSSGKGTSTTPDSSSVAAADKTGDSSGSRMTKTTAEAEFWNRIHTEDPGTLLNNLRAAGFPPRVLRAIMAAVVAEKFTARRKALFSEIQDRPFWQMKSSANYEYYAKMQALQREQTAMLKEMLGSDYTAAIDDNADYFRRTYGNLSAEKIEALQMINNDYNELRFQIQAETNGIYLPEDREKMAVLERERRADLVALLSPEELAEYDMRTSTTANRMRTQYSTFNFSEQEFRSVYDALKGVDEKYSLNLLNTGSNTRLFEERRAAESTAMEEVKQLLGDQRYAEFERASNGQYRTAARITERLQLPQENAVAVYDLSRQSEQQARGIMQDRNLSREARQQALQGLAKDMDAKLTQYLTPTGAEAFKQSSNPAWQRYLTTPTGGAARTPGN